MFETLITRLRAQLATHDSPTVDDRLDALTDGVDRDAMGDPYLLFAGPTLPDFSDRLPADWSVCEHLDQVGHHRIMKYQPRRWTYEDGTFVLHDGTLDGDADGEFEFSVRVDPDDYVAYRLVVPMFFEDNDVDIQTRHTVADHN